MNCPRCDGTGFVVVERDGAETAAPCSCDIGTPDMLAVAGVPALERTFTESSLPPQLTRTLAAAREALASGRSVLLAGPVGRGKSGISVVLMRDALDRKQSVLWCHLSTWLRDIRDSFDSRDDDGGRPSEKALLAEASSVGVLVVDDIGAERPSEWAESMLYQLVTNRDSGGRATAYSSNLPLAPDGKGASVESVYGQRVASRLSRCAQIVVAGGVDLRPSAAPMPKPREVEPDEEETPMDPTRAREVIAELRRRLTARGTS